MVSDTGDVTRSRIEVPLLARLPVVHEQALGTLLADADPDVVREAIIAAGALHAEAFVPELIEALGRDAHADEAVAALVQIGEAAVAPLCHVLVAADGPVATAVSRPRTGAGQQRSVRMLPPR
jgi:hypothetical protein